ncbi:response regulator transcription factor [Amycolatopsis endophytica]|uniref:DNA-binding NarL/FixJ family response regulator n=1 Tax=Amycolatopsis endophytica TaxID=860233 RepID=A0A853BFF1_9PSEU|nr:response regulator transcription factor [Amycolatopsis endophytica]NYI93485.1 DNA-binding NarL/FixJ family response regulator [Amycolatopsis endophytica]
MPEPLRLVIADDQALLRGSFRVLVENEPDMTVVGGAATGTEAIEVVRATAPDVVLMDVRMPWMDGIEGTRVLIRTMFDLDSHVFGALRAGAAGFLLKDTRPADLCTAIRVVAAGDALLAPAVTRRLIAEFARTTTAPPRLTRELDVLTPREIEVLTLIAQGLPNTELAGNLHLSMATVKTYIGRLLTRLHARDGAQLVILAYENGLVTASGPV